MENLCLENLGTMDYERWTARFWRKVGDHRPADVCWPWSGSRDDSGYGRCYRGRFFRAHRVAFYLTHGRWPEVCRHTCDNPPCCNPAHLRDGTHADNNRDAVERGRMTGEATRGERHPRTHLAEDDVREIRRRAAGGEAYRVLGRAYGVHPTGISHIVRRNTWRHVD